MYTVVNQFCPNRYLVTCSSIVVTPSKDTRKSRKKPDGQISGYWFHVISEGGSCGQGSDRWGRWQCVMLFFNVPDSDLFGSVTFGLPGSVSVIIRYRWFWIPPILRHSCSSKSIRGSLTYAYSRLVTNKIFLLYENSISNTWCI